MKTRLPAALLSLALSSPLCADETVQTPLLEISSGLPGKQVRLTWTAEAGVRYRIERSTNLSAWKQIALVEATGTAGAWVDPEPTTTLSFYRIVHPQPEVFSVLEPVLPSGGGTIVLQGQRIPAGSKLVVSVDGVEQELELTAVGGGTSQGASLLGGALGGALGGSSVVAVAVKDPSGVVIATLNVPIAITDTGRATDSPPSLPPAAPLASSNPIPGVGIVVKRNGGSYTARAGGDDDTIITKNPMFQPQAIHTKNPMFQAKGTSGTNPLNVERSAGNTNPLYEDKGHNGNNPLYQGRHAISQKGTGTSGRIVPASCGLPGEVSLRHVSLDVPCPAGPALSWICTYRSKVPVESGLGAGWDFSYNISVQPVPLAAGANAPRLIVRDGGGRADVFVRQPNGTYRCDGMFREGSFRNGVFTLTFANAGRWVFRPLDGSPGAGKISSIIDRNDVALTCRYDASGQLSQVDDSFGRSLAVEWSSTLPARIASVTCQDTAGTVGYQKIEFDYLTSAARLSSVSSPFLPGSPPAAGPVSFTYSEGLADPALNGNLLTVHDGAGRLLEGYEYSPVTDPLAPAYDTCSAHDRNRAASTGHQVRTTFAVLLDGGYEACENDELGRVTVATFDKLHRLVRERRYTGFATPDTSVTSTTLPSSATRLRPSDPSYFETSCTYNADSLCTGITYPDGSRERIVFDRDFRKDCPVRERGNARLVTLVSSGGEERTVACDHLPGYGSPEAARPGNPIKGISVKCGGPSGSVNHLIWSPRSNIVGNEICDNGSMPNRLSMTPTTTRQTQGQNFGEKVASGLHAAGSVISQGAKSPRDSASGLATGRRQHSPIVGGGDITYVGTCDALAYIGTCDASGYVGPCDATAGDASFVTRIVTAHGQAFTRGYDARGNLTNEGGPVAGSGTNFTWNTRGQITAVSTLDGPGPSFDTAITYEPTGFPYSVTSDPAGLKIATYFNHDDLGRVTTVTDASSNDWNYGYDMRGTLVSITGPALPWSIVTSATTDLSGQVVRVDTTHQDENGGVMADNPAYSTFYVHDSRGRLVRVAEEDRPVNAPAGVLTPDTLGLENFAVTDFSLDAAGQVTRVSIPAASRGQAVDLACDFTYDERGLLHRVIDGGASAITPVITENDYDLCGAPVRVTAVASGIPVPQVSFTWDGFHRLSSATDPMGNVTSMSYDNKGFVTTSVVGELQDMPGSAANVLLYRATTRGGGPSLRAFNQNSSRSNNASAFACAFNQNASRSNHTRLSLTADLFFDVVTPDDTCVEERFAIGGSAEPAMETTTVHRSPSGLPMSVTCNGDSLLTMAYDTAGRLSSFSNGATTTELRLNLLGDIIECAETDHSDNDESPSKTFTTYYGTDEYGRCTSINDGMGNASMYGWDSLGRCVYAVDPGGLEMRIAYDGSSATGPFSRQAIADVDGDGKPDVLSTVYCRGGEPVHAEDSYGHRTSFVRDELGRLTRSNYPDGTYEATTYDSVGRPTGQRQKNGTVIACDFDFSGALHSISHTQVPAGVIAVAPTSFVYNGLGDCVSCLQGTSLIQWTYDSLGNPLSETQGSLTVSRSFNHRGRTGITYPDGRRFAESRNPLGHLLSVTSLTATGVPVSPPVVVLQYEGSRVWRSTQANGVVTTYTYRADGETGGPDYSFDTCTEMTATNSLGHELTHVIQQRDRNQRLTGQQTLYSSSPQGPGRQQTFTRDALGRITASLTRRRDAGQSQPTTESSVSYILGKEGRRIQEVRNGVTGHYSQDSALPPGDQQMDQYTSWPGGDLKWDDEGNLRSIDGGGVKADYQYDAEGRLVAVMDVTNAANPPALLVSYGYDAIGRRISRTVPGTSGAPAVTTAFVHDGSACIQEWSDDGTGTGTTNAAVTFACAEGIKYGIATRDGSVYYPLATAAAATDYRHCTCTPGFHMARSSGGSRTCTCPSGFYYAAAKNKVEHWGDPHENLNGKHIKDWEGIASVGGGRVWPKSGYWSALTDSAGAVTERFDCDDAGKPIFLDAAGVPTSSSSAVGPVRWMAPESMWEPSIGMLLGPGAVYCPDLGMTVATGYGHVTVLKAAATGDGGGSGGSAKVQDHNSSRSNKSSS